MMFGYRVFHNSFVLFPCGGAVNSSAALVLLTWPIDALTDAGLNYISTDNNAESTTSSSKPIK
jgi:hypothetical protein